MSRFRPDALSEGLRNFFSKKESNEKKPPAQPVRPAAEVEPVLEKIPITSIQNENEIHKPEYSPELTQEELETVKQALSERIDSGEILVQVKAQRFFENRQMQDNRQLKQADLVGTGINLEDLLSETRGEQAVFFTKLSKGYKEFAKRFGTEFTRKLLRDGHLRGGNFIPLRSAEISGKGNLSKRRDYDAENVEKDKRGFGLKYLFTTEVGNVYMPLNGKSIPVTFLHIEIVTPNGKSFSADGSGRASSLHIHAYIGPSNSPGMYKSFNLPPMKQSPFSLAMIFRALKTDPDFLIKFFKEKLPEAFAQSDKKSYYYMGNNINIPPGGHNYYPEPGKNANRTVVFTLPTRTLKFKQDFITTKA